MDTGRTEEIHPETFHGRDVSVSMCALYEYRTYGNHVRACNKTHLSFFMSLLSHDIDSPKHLYRMGSQALVHSRHCLCSTCLCSTCLCSTCLHKVKVKFAIEQAMKIQKREGG